MCGGQAGGGGTEGPVECAGRSGDEAGGLTRCPGQWEADVEALCRLPVAPGHPAVSGGSLRLEPGGLNDFPPGLEELVIQW